MYSEAIDPLTAAIIVPVLCIIAFYVTVIRKS